MPAEGSLARFAKRSSRPEMRSRMELDSGGVTVAGKQREPSRRAFCPWIGRCKCHRRRRLAIASASGGGVRWRPVPLVGRLLQKRLARLADLDQVPVRIAEIAADLGPAGLRRRGGR